MHSMKNIGILSNSGNEEIKKEKKMKKALTILIVCLFTVTAVFASGAPEATANASTIQERTIHFSTTSAEGTEIVNVMRNFADLVSKATDGKITVEVYPGSTLGSATDTRQNCQLGVQEMAVGTAADLASVGATQFKAFALPYVFRDVEHLMAVCHGEVGQEVLASVQPSGTKLVGIGFWSEGTRNFITKTPVRSISDIKGLKLRCQANDIDTDMCLALGASPTPLAFGELYSALQTGVVDGAENPLSALYSNKFHEVCKYITLDAHSCPPVVVMFSEVIWKTYSEEEQKIIMESWEQASAHNLEYLQAAEEKFINLFESEGVEVIRLNDKEAWQAAMAPLYEKYGSDIKQTMDAISAVK